MKKQVGLVVFGSILFLFFVYFSYLVHKNIFTQLDFDITVRLQDNISRKYDHFFSVFSLIGNVEPMAILLLVLTGILVFKKKLMGVLAAMVALGGFAAFHFFEIFGKTFVRQFPPPEFMVRTEKLIEFPQFHIRKEFSYPSGHAGRAAFLSILVFMIIIRSKKLNREQKLFVLFILFIYDITMFVSRIYLGEHWLTDIIGGILLGGSISLIAVAF